MIEVRDVSFRYPKAEADALTHVSLRVNPGEILALTGRNGCGKTTVARLIAGILRPSAGEILIDGENIAPMDLFAVGQRVGYVFQDPSRQLFCDTVMHEICFGLERLGIDKEEMERRALRYMDILRIAPLRDAFPGTLSRGEKQRVVLACVLSMGTKYLLLDEPTGGLDMRGRDTLAALITEIKTERRCGILLISHERPFIGRVADREEAMGA